MSTDRNKSARREGRVHRRRLAAGALGVGLLLLGSAAAADEPWTDERLSPPEVEAAYGGAGDEISLAQARELLLELTNAARRDAGVPAVQWLDLAAGVAQDHADEMVEHQLIGHYDIAGRTCEQRYNAAGGADQIVENTSYYEIQHEVYLTPQLVRRVHAHWLGSARHRANLLAAAHTHLGAGFAVSRLLGVTRVAAVAEFVNDYGDYAVLPEQARLGDVMQLSGRMAAGAELRFLGIGVADPPQPLAAGRRRQAGYSQPIVVLALVPRQQPARPAPGIEFVRYEVDYDARSGEFSARIWLEPDWPSAAYHFTVWAAEPDAGQEAVCVMTQVVLVE